MFQPGELVSHPIYGLCRIHAIQKAKGFGKSEEDCFVFLIGSSQNKTTVFLPVRQAGEAGLRYPITRIQAEGLLRILQMPADGVYADLQPQEVLERFAACLHQSDIFKLAEAVRNFSKLGFADTDFYFENLNSRKREQILFDRAVGKLIEELSLSSGSTGREMRKKIRLCLKKAKPVFLGKRKMAATVLN